MNKNQAIEHAVRRTAEMHRNAWKGRVDPDELDSLIQCLLDKGTEKDKKVLKYFEVKL